MEVYVTSSADPAWLAVGSVGSVTVVSAVGLLGVGGATRAV